MTLDPNVNSAPAIPSASAFVDVPVASFASVVGMTYSCQAFLANPTCAAAPIFATQGVELTILP